MFIFPTGLYTDVRIEEVVEGLAQIQNGELKENKQRKYKGIFIRVFDGNRWYYSSITDDARINEEIAKLAKMATSTEDILSHPAIKRLEVNEDTILSYENNSIKDISKAERLNLIKEYEDVVVSFEYEPIVRMTTTYVDKGTQTKDELFAGVKEGIYVEDVKHGSGLSAFTIAPAEAYMIRDGKIAEPITVAVVTGNVMGALHLIDGVSDEVELFSFVGGGCGKGEQWPLPVGFGGPYIRVKELDVQ